MSDEVIVDDLENSLPSWIFDHLGERSYMEIELIKFLSSPKEDSSWNEGDPPVDTRLPPKREMNITTQDELDHLHELCSFPVGIQMRHPEAGETIVSTRLGDMAFYKGAFQTGLHLPIHPTLRRILAF